MHRLPRVDSVAPNVGHDGINEVLPLYIYEVRHWFRHLCSAPWQNQTGSDIKLALHHKIVSSLLSLKNLKIGGPLA